MASTIKVNNIQNQCGANIVNKCSTTITLGASGDTIQLACGASQTGFSRTGTVDWNTTAITADPANAVSGTGYFADTSGGAFNVTLPTSPSAGDIVAVADYANTFNTNNLTIVRNGSNIEGNARNFVCNQDGVSITFVYVDATKGWITVNAGNSSQAFVNNFICATGGTETTCGDYKIHTFTGPGTFTVNCAGNPSGSTTVDYLVVAGGAGGGGVCGGGGGGAGGFRESSGTASGCYTASPLGACVSALPVTAQAYPVTVGGGGSASGPGNSNPGGTGSNSVFSTITSNGGGSGNSFVGTGGSGGSGGGGGGRAGDPGGSGNTPPVSPPQGNPGGNAAPSGSPPGVDTGGGGGGATASGANGSDNGPGGNGGAGATTSISATPTAYAGGGGGGSEGGSAGTGGSGGGGPGGSGASGHTAGTANTGGGGGGIGTGAVGGNAGGSGIVIIRYKFQ